MGMVIINVKTRFRNFLLHTDGGVDGLALTGPKTHILTHFPFQNVWRCMVYTVNAAISYVTGNVRGGLAYNYMGRNG